ncbi:MAG: CopG family transcriptional regulator [Candidatus Binataceae bacterium]
MTKFFILLPDSLARFAEYYRKKRGWRSRSQVFEEAIKLLRSRELEAAYGEAAAEYDKSWEAVSSDGLPDET